MMTHLLGDYPCFLSLKLKCLSQERVEGLIDSLVEATEDCHEERCNPCNPLIGVWEKGSLMHNVLTSSYFSDSLKDRDRLAEGAGDGDLPEFISIYSSHNEFLYNLKVVLIIRLSSKREFGSLLVGRSNSKSVPEFMSPSNRIDHSFRLPTRRSSLYNLKIRILLLHR
jgi:hypothetical protein